MKAFKLIALIGFVSLSFAFQPKRATQIPDVMVKDLKGAEVNLSDYSKDGKVTIITFWATWCKPCIAELDAMAELYDDWKEAYGVEIIAVSLDDQRTLNRLKPVVEAKEWEYTVLSDVNKDTQRAFNFQTPPYLVLVNKDGDIVYKHNGYLPGGEYEVEEELEKL